jgi:hypothetical protein
MVVLKVVLKSRLLTYARKLVLAFYIVETDSLMAIMQI